VILEIAAASVDGAAAGLEIATLSIPAAAVFLEIAAPWTLTAAPVVEIVALSILTAAAAAEIAAPSIQGAAPSIEGVAPRAFLADSGHFTGTAWNRNEQFAPTGRVGIVVLACRVDAGTAHVFPRSALQSHSAAPKTTARACVFRIDSGCAAVRVRVDDRRTRRCGTVREGSRTAGVHRPGLRRVGRLPAASGVREPGARSNEPRALGHGGADAHVRPRALGRSSSIGEPRRPPRGCSRGRA
jgi:hypothetical protein